MSDIAHLATVQTEGVVTHVLVPIEEYQRLTASGVRKADGPSDEQIDEAIAILNDSKTEWVDGEEVFENIVRDGIEYVRRMRGMSQGELGKRVGLSQPQVSRIESRPEQATLEVLRRIADVLVGPRNGEAKKPVGTAGRSQRRTKRA